MKNNFKNTLLLTLTVCAFTINHAQAQNQDISDRDRLQMCEMGFAGIITNYHQAWSVIPKLQTARTDLKNSETLKLTLQKDIQQLRQIADKANAELKLTKQKEEWAQTQLNSHRENNRALVTKYNTLTTDIAAANDSVKTLTAQLNQLKSTFVVTRTNHMETLTNISKYEKTMATINARIAKLNEDLNNTMDLALMQTIMAEQGRLRQEYSNARTALRAAKENLPKLIDLMNTLPAQIAALENKLKVANNALAELNKQYQPIAKDYAAYETKEKSLATTYEAAKLAFAKATTKYSEILSNLNASNKKLAELPNTIATLEALIRSYMQQMTNFTQRHRDSVENMRFYNCHTLSDKYRQYMEDLPPYTDY